MNTSRRTFIAFSRNIFNKMNANKSYYYFELPIITGSGVGTVYGGAVALNYYIKNDVPRSFKDKYIDLWLLTTGSCTIGGLVGFIAGAFWPITVSVFVVNTVDVVYNKVRGQNDK